MGFESYQLHEKLKQLWQDRITGTLTCAIKGYEKKLFLKDGIVCFATSTDPEDKLPSVLVRQGRFSEDQFRSAEPNFNDKISIGRNLIEMGLITQSELVEGAKEQIYTVFASCMLAETGSEQFEEGPLPSGIVSLPLKYPRDFFRSILAMHDKVWISSQFGNALSFVPTPNPDKRLDFGKLEIAEFAEPVYKLIDGELNFNHLTFEAEIDDFMLLKYLHALHFLDYISIEADENEPEPEVESVLEDLGRAMEQSQQVERLKNEVDLSGMSMEDTVALPAMKGKVTPPSGSMDVTMEVSRDILGSAQLSALFGDDASEEDQEDERKAPKAPLIPGFEAFDEDEEEAGLDDLGALSPNFLEQELQRDEPLGYVPEGVIMPDPEDEDELEEDEVAQASPSRRRLLLICATGLTLIGLLMTFRPYLESHLNPFSPDTVKLETAQQAAEPEKLVDNPLEPPAEPITSEPEAQAVAANAQATPTESVLATETQTTPIAPLEEPSSAPEQAQASIEPPIKSSAAQVQDPLKETTSAPKLSAKAAVPVYRSPIAEAWDPKTNRPRGQSQAPLGDAVINDEDTLPPGSETSSVTLATSKPPAPRVNTSANKSQDPPKPVAQRETKPETPKPSAVAPPAKLADQPNAELVPITSTAKAESPKPGPTAPESNAEAQRLFAEQSYDAAAKLWKQRINISQYTFAVSDICSAEAIAQARSAIGTDPRLFLLPNPSRGPDCFWLCWGTYDKRVQAILARKQLPEGFANIRSEAIALKTLLK